MTAPTPVVARAGSPWASIDDVLGPSRTRFFGSGYRSTRPRLRDLRVTHLGERSTLGALGSLDVGGTWSRKQGREQRPHLATTDALALTAQCLTALLATRFAPETAAAAAVTEIEVRASDIPLEDELDAFGVTAGIDAGGVAGSHAFDAAVGPLAVRGRVRRPLAVESLAELSSVGALAALCGEGQTYGSGVMDHAVEVYDGRPDGDDLVARCDVHADGGADHLRGLESDRQPTLTLLDAFVAALQLGQVLLYDLDALDRARSSTLWMRRTTVRASAAPRGTGPFIARARLARARVVARDDVPWRLADLVATVGPYEVVCSVAHVLPDGSATNAADPAP